MEPEGHIARALQLFHPMDSTIVLPDRLMKALFAMVTKEPAVLARERLEMLKLYRNRAADLSKPKQSCIKSFQRTFRELSKANASCFLKSA